MKTREQDYEELDTVVKLFERSVGLYGGNTLMMEKEGGEWKKWTYSEIREMAREFGAGLRQKGLQKGDRVALLAEGRRDWLVAELGMFYAGVVNVPLSVKLDAATEVIFRLQHSGARMIVVSGQQAAKMTYVTHENTSIEKIIYLDGKGEDAEGLTYAEICEAGREWLSDAGHAAEFETWVGAIGPDDLANISYTSGTTSDPKGIMLTQRNYAANAMQSCTRVTIAQDAVTLTILPWDHSFGHTVCLYCFIYYGAAIAAQETGRNAIETLRNIPKNIREVRPTLMMSVPALSKAFRKSIESGIRDKGAATWRLFEMLMRVAYAYNGDWWNRGRGWRKLLWPMMKIGDKLIFSKIKENFGGRLAHFIGGGALLDIELQRFFAAVGIPITQGYGLSEASPVISTNALHACKFGSSGKIVGFMDLKICDTEGRELPQGEQGEIVIRGANVMKGYWRNESATAECLRDGWLHTGDMGYVDGDGFLYVKGRFKSLLIGSDGEKYSPEGIEESIVELSEHIDQCMIYNNQSQYTVGFVTPNEKALERTLKTEGLEMKSEEGRKRSLELIGEEIAAFKRGGIHAGMHPERWLPSAVAVLPEPMNEQNKMLNSTMKMVRSKVTETYTETLQALFTAEMKDICCRRNMEAIGRYA